MVAELVINGSVTPGFERVSEALGRSFREHGEVGAALAVVVDGRPVVDIWAGWLDKARTRPWQRDSIVNLYSTTKGVAAVAAAMLVDRGKLDVDAPVTAYWPEFGQAGKAGIPVRWLLSHEAGLPAIDEPLPPGGALDWETAIHALERQAPSWPPGTAMGYHAVTYGWLVGEVIRRITGKSPGTFVREEIAGPLGIDLFIGTPASEDYRIADMLPPEGRAPLGVMDPNSLAAKALGVAAPPAGADVNSREWRAAELPAANGHGNARALARLYGAVARGGEIDGVRLLGAAAIEQFATEVVSGPDKVIGIEARRGLGFILSSPGGRYHWGPNPRAFGHSGAGGSLGFADPDARIGFGYAMNQMASGLSADPRWHGLIDSVYACL
jgi:CubicO group peptidase (beta-lactamase class C family)